MTIDTDFTALDETIEPTRSSGLLGRGATRHEPSLALHLHRQTATVPPASADLRKGRTLWDILGNDQFGDCGPAATEHARMVKAMIRAYTDTSGVERVVYEPRFRAPHTPYTLWLYWNFGLNQGEPGPHPDQGVVLVDWLTWLYQHEIIEGFAEVDGNPASVYPDGLTARQRVDEATVTFEGVLTGVSLTPDAEARFMRRYPWMVSPNNQPDPSLGHAVYRVAYDPTGCEYITWGENQRATMAWEETCASEYWVILTKEDAERKGVDWASLKSALDALPNAQFNPRFASSAVNATVTMPSFIERVVRDVEQIPLKVESEAIKLWHSSTPNEQFIAKELVRLLELSVAGTPQAQLVPEIERLLKVLS